VISAAVAALCQGVPNEKGQATAYYNKLKSALDANSNFQTYFSQTLAYISDSNEEKAFLAGGTTCNQFFIGLKGAFVADLQADQFSPKAIEALILQFIDILIGTVKANQG